MSVEGPVSGSPFSVAERRHLVSSPSNLTSDRGFTTPDLAAAELAIWAGAINERETKERSEVAIHNIRLADILDPLRVLQAERVLQRQFQVQRAGIRVWTIRRDLLEPKLAIHGHRIFHHRPDGVKADRRVLSPARLGDDALGQGAAQSLAAKLRTQVETLHFADAGAERVQGNAARELAVEFGQQQAATGWSVVAGKLV